MDDRLALCAQVGRFGFQGVPDIRAFGYLFEQEWRTQMRNRELSLHREAVMIQAWRSGKIYWFAERARKYGQIEPRSIWAGSIVVVSRRGHEHIEDESGYLV